MKVDVIDRRTGRAKTMQGRFARVLVKLGRVSYAHVQAVPVVAVVNPAADLLAGMDGMNFMAFRSAARSILGDDCPDKKAEIIEALKAKAAE